MLNLLLNRRLILIDKIINILKYFFLGLLQGFTEVLPVSSSGHLQIASEVLNISDESVTLSVLLHIASLLAVLIYLRKELIELIKGFFGFIFKDRVNYKNQFMLAIYLCITTIILVIFTIIMKLIGFDKSPLWLVGLCLVINAIMLFCFGKFTGNKSIYEINLKDSIVIGLFQCAGSLAGISRSGSCLCGCKVRNIEKEASAKYAFLLFVPAMVGATVLEFKDLTNLFIDTSNLYLYIISFIVTFVTTYFAFAFLKKIINKGKITYFGIYCAIIGIVTFIYALIVK